MNQTSPSDIGRGPFGALWPYVWFAAMVLACLSVALINGEPLFYYDSPAYVDQGGKILDQLGILTVSGNAAGVGAESVAQDNSVNGSRSAVYSVIVAFLVRLRGLDIVPVAHTILVIFAVWLTVRSAKTAGAIQASSANLIAIPLLVACAGSLPFYLASVMPDILAPLLILMIAVLAIYGESMGKLELFLAFSLGALAVVSHISHIAIAAVMVPVVALMAYLVGNRRWWLSTILVILMVLVGVGERMAFKAAANSLAETKVVYIPFLTARLIEDGPGLRYLDQNCPDAGLQTCALHDALSKSDDPMRFTASHIIFERKPHLGSFRFLDTDTQAKVAQEQYRFFFKTLAFEPVGTFLAILKNTAAQSTLYSVDMAVTTDHILRNTLKGYPALQDEFSHGRISSDQGWLPHVSVFHTGVYVVSLVVLGLGLLWRAPANMKVKGFVIAVLIGIAANAFVCGAVSQPASRYGARVIWLLPFMATFQLIIWAATPRKVVQ